MATQHFFVAGKHLGSRTIPDLRVIPGLEVRFHYSHAFFCMRCGEVWGRMLHERSELTQCTIRPCLRHGDGKLSTTHYFAGEPWNFEDNWPPAAVAHEFQAELALLDRNENAQK